MKVSLQKTNEEKEINIMENSSSHYKQKIFLEPHQSPLGKKFNKLNKMEDESCWSGSLRDSQIAVDVRDIMPSFNEEINNCVTKRSKDASHLEILQAIQEQQSEEQGDKTANTTRQKQNTKLLFINLQSRQSQNKEESVDLNSPSPTCTFSKVGEKITNQKRNFFQKSLYQGQENGMKSTNNQKRNPLNFYMKMKQRILRYYNRYTFNGRTSLLNEQIRIAINDKSDYLKLQKKKQKLENWISTKIAFILNKLDCLKNLPVVHYLGSSWFTLLVVSTFINYWLLYFYSCLIIFEASGDWLNTFYHFYKSFWITEIIFKIYTLLLSVIRNIDNLTLQQDFLKYLKMRALFDFLPLFSLFYLETNQIFEPLVLTKLVNIAIDYGQIQKQLCRMIKRYYVVQIVNLIQKLILIGHCIACLWYLINRIENKYLGETHTWVDSLREEDQIWWRLYIWSIYWALTLMTTGSNVATTITQACFTSIIMLFITISFGYILNIIGYILSEMDETGLQKRKDISIINSYMRQRNISKQFI